MRTLLIDADDTLWESNIHYLRCSSDFCLWLGNLGVPRIAIEAAIAHHEQQVIPSFGYSPYGYIEALALATRQLAIEYHLEVTPELLEKARSFGIPMLHPPLILFPLVYETLAALSNENRLMLVTKGDILLQKKKLERSGLASFFAEVYVLEEKDAAGYRDLVHRERLDPSHTWMIGNSPKSDINPAIEAGLNAIYIPYDFSWAAEYVELARSPRVCTLQRFSDLTDHFNQLDTWERGFVSEH